MPHIRAFSPAHINTPVTLNQYKAQKETTVGAKNIEKTNLFQYNETVARRPSAIMTKENLTASQHPSLFQSAQSVRNPPEQGGSHAIHTKEI